MYLHRLLLLLIPALYLLLPPFINGLQQLNGPWYRPFIIWSVVVIIAAIIEGKRRHA